MRVIYKSKQRRTGHQRSFTCVSACVHAAAAYYTHTPCPPAAALEHSTTDGYSGSARVCVCYRPTHVSSSKDLFLFRSNPCV